MFEMDECIRSWRQAAGSRLGNDAELLDELESHLREEVDRLIAAGQTPAEAWETAVNSLGEPQKLAGEFAKVRMCTWTPAVLAAGTLSIFSILVTCFVVGRIGAGRMSLLLGAHVLSVTCGYTAMLALGTLGVCATVSRTLWGWSGRQDLGFRAGGFRIAQFAVGLTFLGFALGAFWSHLNLNRWWGWDPREIGAVGILIWGCIVIASCRLRFLPARLRMGVAVIAGIVVAVGWFGLFYFPSVRSYGLPTIGRAVVIGFIAFQLLVLCLASLPAGPLRAKRMLVR